jgi:hypothetical protein
VTYTPKFFDACRYLATSQAVLGIGKHAMFNAAFVSLVLEGVDRWKLNKLIAESRR